MHVILRRLNTALLKFRIPKIDSRLLLSALAYSLSLSVLLHPPPSVLPGYICPFLAVSLQELKQYPDAAKDLKTILDKEPKNAPVKRELESVKKLWREELRELQQRSSQQHDTTASKSEKKPTGKSPHHQEKKSSSVDASGQRDGRKAENVSKTQSSDVKGTPLVESLLGGLHEEDTSGSNQVGKSAVEMLLGDRGGSQGGSQRQGPEGETLMKASKTTYYKEEKGEGQRDPTGTTSKRKRITIEEVDSSGSEGEREGGGTSSAATGTRVRNGRTLGKEVNDPCRSYRHCETHA